MESTLLDTLEKATQADLDVILAEIGDLEKQLAKRNAQRKMVEILLGVGPKRGGKPKKTATPTPPFDDENDDADEKPKLGNATQHERRVRIAKLLINGPQRVAWIAEELGCSLTTVYDLIKHPWFNKNAAGEVSITTAGRAAATGKPQSA